MGVVDLLISTGADTLIDVAPIVAVLVGFQLAVLRRPIPNLRRIVTGLVCVVLGLTLFLVGLQEALFPLGRTMAQQLVAEAFADTSGAPPDWTGYAIVYLFAASIGFATSIAEPAVLAVAMKANQASGGTVPVFGLRVAVALGVAIGVAVGCLRIVTGGPLVLYLCASYAVVALQTLLAPRRIIPLAYDVGGVTTSTVTVPVVASLGLGLASTIPGRNPLVDGFGLIAFACLFPIMAVLAYASLADRITRRKLASGKTRR
ncbi:MAG: DUF1538 domain-containing protein [Rhodospirillales bacterium]